MSLAAARLLGCIVCIALLVSPLEAVAAEVPPSELGKAGETATVTHDEAAAVSEEAADGDERNGTADAEAGESDELIAVDTAAASGPIDSQWPRERGPMPYEIVRSLQFLQDQVARGNASAIRVQSMLLKRYGPTFLELEPQVWEDPRNRRAAALFVLSGGPPSVLREILARITIAPEDRLLLEGSLAYVENRSVEAERRLSAVDLELEEAGLAAQVHLAVAQLQQNDKPEAALKRLQRVMLLAPGTLLEEAALRMGVLLAEQSGDPASADRYARQYFERFPNSAYAGNFRARFAAVYADRPAGTEDAVIAAIADATRTIPPQEQLAIYLAVGRRALVSGKLALSATAAAKALTYDEASRSDRQRALLYEVASTVTERAFGEVKATFEAIDREALHPADRQLRDAAVEVLSEMRKPLAAGHVSPDAPPDTSPPSPILARGAAILDAVRDDLKKATP